MKKFILFLLCLGATLSLPAQNRISGRVSDENGEPLAGASVLIEGTRTGTVADLDGRWTLQARPDQNLVISYIGYEDVTLRVTAARSVYDVTLSSDQNFLDDVVVVGYGTQKKVNLTGSVSSVSSEALEKKPILNASTALQGIAAGVTVTTRSGAPGGDGGVIRVRGLGTFGQSSSAPLVLIDGVQGSMSDIDASQIDKISVLKDAASSAIYGSRAANGVILVTTKRGTKGKTSVTYRGYAGVQTPTDLPKLVNAEEYMTLSRETSLNDGTTPLYTEEFIQNYRANHKVDPDNYPISDFQKMLLTGSGFMHNHNLSMVASTDKVKVRTSVAYLDQQGIIKQTDFRRFNVRNNMNIDLTDNLAFRFDMAMAYSNRRYSPHQSTIFNYMNTRDPLVMTQFANGVYYGVPGNSANVLPYLEGLDGVHRVTTLRLSGTMALTWKPFKWLTLDGTVSPRFITSNNHNWLKVTTTYADAFGTPGFSTPAYNHLDEATDQDYYGSYIFTATAGHKFGSHDLKFLLGTSYEDYDGRSLSAYRQDFSYPDYDVINAGADNETKDNGGSRSQWALASYFARFNYNFKERYLFEANVRVDGSSRFVGANRYATFPSFSAAWRVTEEPFMARIRPVLTEFKLRASYGTLGNQSIGSNYPTIQSLAVSSISANGAILPIVTLNTMANRDITWETARMLDVGLDFSLFNKVEFTADWYNKVTEGVLLRLEIPRTIGLTAPYQNAGTVLNRGWEVAVSYQDRKGDWSWGIDANLSDVHNEITYMANGKPNIHDNFIDMVGYPINSIWGYECIGMARTQEEADYVNYNVLQFNTPIKPGQLVYKDQPNVPDAEGNLVGDGVINDNDMTVIGNCIPRYTYGITLNAGWKGIGLSAFFQGVGKVDGFLNSYYVMPNVQGGTYRKEHLDRWTEATPDGYFPRMTDNVTNDQKISSFWVRSAAYCRLKNIQLSYTLPKKAVSRLGLGSVMFFVNGSNVFTWTNFYQGFDPEVNFSGDFDGNLNGVTLGAANNYPQVKTFTGGVEIKF